MMIISNIFPKFVFSRLNPNVPRFRVALVSLAVGASAQAHAQVAAKSPFIAVQEAASNAPLAGAPLEYRGYIEIGEGVQFRLYDPGKKSGTWVKLKERNPDLDVTVKQHDISQETLTIEYQGKTLTLKQCKAVVVSSGPAIPVMPLPTTPTVFDVALAVTQGAVLNSTPADEHRLLDAVSTQVAQRRALREKAAQR